jgi:hypothetical protein
METSEFFSHVLGDDGFYCIFAVNGETKERKLKFYTTKTEALYSALQLDAKGSDTYFGLATFADGTVAHRCECGALPGAVPRSCLRPG